MYNDIPIFCINLDRAKERKKLIQKKWIDELGFEITFWNSYDRRDIENNKFIYKYDKSLSISLLKRELNCGEIACATSFCMLYEYILNNNIKEVIIMEDDVTPLVSDKNEVFHYINQGKLEFPKAELMLMHNLHSHQMKNSDKIYTSQKKYFSKCLKAPYGNQFFYSNKNTIQKLYQILKTMNMPADWAQQILIKNGAEVIISNKPLCFHHWNGHLSTTYIGNELRNTKRRFIQ
jgi:GR25 family glycosyltransferase involved in LPS biosynthesis